MVYADRQGSLISTETEFEWALGEAGFSMYLTKDNIMILGAPGVSQWKGVYVYLAQHLILIDLS